MHFRILGFFSFAMASLASVAIADEDFYKNTLLSQYEAVKNDAGLAILLADHCSDYSADKNAIASTLAKAIKPIEQMEMASDTIDQASAKYNEFWQGWGAVQDANYFDIYYRWRGATMQSPETTICTIADVAAQNKSSVGRFLIKSNESDVQRETEIQQRSIAAEASFTLLQNRIAGLIGAECPSLIFNSARAGSAMGRHLDQFDDAFGKLSFEQTQNLLKDSTVSSLMIWYLEGLGLGAQATEEQFCEIGRGLQDSNSIAGQWLVTK